MQLSEQLRRRSLKETSIMVSVFAAFLIIVYTLIPEADHDLVTEFCPQSLPLTVKGDFESSQKFYTEKYANLSLEFLQGAIRAPTMSFDDMKLDPTDDIRFDVFADLHEHLHRSFPHAAKNSERVNHYGLLYSFKGSNPSLKPVILMSHQDVVPVPQNTVSDWEYPPFGGHYDGEFLHGRGTADTKNTLVGILESVEDLLRQGWKPQRTLLISFGFDEEIGGIRGASFLAETIEQRYGKDGIELVVDEGFGMPELYGALMGLVLVGEKGYVDIEVSLQTPGGHSSRPPDHTGIGLMSELVKRLEAHPFPSSLDNSNPTLGFYQCAAEHAPLMNKELRRTILDIDSGEHRSELIEYLSSIREMKYLIRTSQAVDVIEGGVKINALPEKVTMKVNHRVDLRSSAALVLERMEDLVANLANEIGLGMFSQGESVIDSTPKGFFNVTLGRSLEPAPLAPHYGSQWDLITGTTHSIMQAIPSKFKSSGSLVMAPGLFPANTDTRHYWNLTRAIYRFTPAFGDDMRNYHTVDERLRFRSHLMTVAWFYEFILNTTL